MSTEIDNKVVSMEFDNRNFESNVKTSMSTIDKLKQSLDFSTASKGIEAVQAKFSAFEVIAVTALANITTSAFNAGKELVKSLSIDNISAGWAKFGEKTTSVGTLISQGYDIDTVTEQLERLNWFTDETSYNFTDMVANIAKFTASGQDLETSVTAIEGIANWAALSGQNASTASRAMYQLSQAIGAGSMRLEDFRSIQNVSMDTDEFRQKALDAAVALGKLRKNADDTYTSLVGDVDDFTKSQFAQSLTKGAWFDKDVMMEVFTEYSSVVDQIYDYSNEKGITASEAIDELGDSVDQFGLKAFKAAQEARTWEDVVGSVKDAVSTGWMNTFELIFGNYEEAKVLWTDLANELYDVFAEGGNARNELLAEWKELGGRNDLVEAFWNVYNSILDIVNTVKESFREIFPEKTAFQLAVFTKRLKLLTQNLSLSSPTLEKLSSIFRGFFAVLDIGKQAVSALWNGAKRLIGMFRNLGIRTFDAASSFGEWLVKLDKAIKEGDIFNKVISRILDVVDLVRKKISDFVKVLNGLFQILKELNVKAFKSFSGMMLSMFEPLVNSETFKKAVQTITDVTGKIYEKIKEFYVSVKDIFSNFGSIETDGIESIGDKLKNIFKPIVAVFEALTRVVGGIFGVLKKFVEYNMPVFDAIIATIGKVASAIGNALKNVDADRLTKLFNGGVLVAIGIEIKKIMFWFKRLVAQAERFNVNINYILSNVGDTLYAFQVKLQAGSLLKIAIAIGILTVSLIALSGIDPGAMTVALGAIAALGVELQKLYASMSKAGKLSITSASSIVIISVAILVLAAALKKISDIGYEGLAVGLTGVIGLIVTLVSVSKKLSRDSKHMIKTAVGLIAFALAIRLLVKPVKQLGSLDIKTLASGLIAVGVLCAELALFLKTADLDNMGLLKGLGLMALAESINILSKAVGKFGSMDLVSLAKGLGGVGVILLEIAGFSKLMSGTKGLISTGIGMTIIAASMLIFGEAIENIGELSWEEIAKGLLGIAGALLSVAAAMKIMPSGSKMIAAGTSLILVGSAMLIFGEAIENIGDLSWEELAKGLIGIAGALASVTAAFRLMPNSGKVIAASTSMLLVAAAMLVMGEAIENIGQLSWEEIAKGLTAMAVSLGAIVVAMKFMDAGSIAGAAAVVVCAAALMLLVPVLKALGTMQWDEIVKGLVAIAGVLGILALAGTLLEPCVSGILGLAAALALIGVGTAAFGVGLLAISIALEAFSLSAGMFVQTIVDILIGLVTAIPRIIGELAKALTESVPAIVECLTAITRAALESLKEIVPLALETLFFVIMEVLNSLAQNIKPIIASLLQIVINILDGLAEGIPQIVSSAVALLKSVIDSIMEAVGEFDLESILTATAALVAFAAMMALVAVIAAEAVIATAMLPVIGKNLSSFIDNVTPFLDGIKNIDPNSLNGAKILAETILILTAASLIDGISSWFSGGDNPMVKFGKDLVEFAPYFKQYYNDIKGVDSGVIEASANAAKALAEFAQNIPNNGGFVSWIVGDNSLTEFAQALPELGTNLKAYSDNVTGLKADVVVNSANAALALAELAHNLPNSGGAISLLFGDNSLVEFSADLPDLGKNLKAYSDNVTGLDPEVVVDSANAALALSELAHNLPNSGGVISWIAGDNSLVEFSAALPDLGENLKFYSDSVKGLEPDVVINSANAAQALSELASNLPNSGGVISWFAGDNSLVEFSAALPAFGLNLKAYSDNVKGLEPDVVINSANAAKALAEMASNLPNSGGVASWFAGENDLSDFADELAEFGPKLKAYADSVDGLKSGVVVESANAAKALAEMAANLPNSGGVVSWFAGDNLLSEFADELSDFGPKLMAYSKSVTGLKAGVVIESANAALAIANLANNLPNSGGVVAVFTGDNTLSSFAEELAEFGPSLMSYANSVDGLKASVVVNSISAATALAELASNLPTVGGIGAVFSGDSSLSTFARELAEFGPKFKSYSQSVEGINSSVVVDSANAAKALAELANNLPDTGGLVSWFTGDQDLGDFGDTLAEFGEYFKEYYGYIQGIDVNVLNAVTKETKNLIDMADQMKLIDTDTVSDFGDALEDLGEAGVDGFILAFTNATERIQGAARGMLSTFTTEADSNGSSLSTTFTSILDTALTDIDSKKGTFATYSKELVESFAKGASTNAYQATNAFNQLISNVLSNTKTYTRYNEFYNMGTYFVDGFASGITNRTWWARAKSAAMAQSALDAAKDTLRINSPSKAAYELGDYTGLGFVNALDDYGTKAFNAGQEMAESAKEGLGDAIINIADLIEDGIDTEPTITPVIDLTEIQNGKNQLYRMMDNVGYSMTGSLNMANQTATGMNRMIRNKYVNSESESSITPADSGLNSSTVFENTFNITGDNPREIADEVSRIIQQQVERRAASWA